MIDWDNQPLGKISDYEIARMLNVKPSSVCSARHRRNIKACTQAGRRGKPKRTVWINWDAQPLGQVFDSILADTLGVCSQTVQLERRKRGIIATCIPDIDWNLQPLGEMTDLDLAKLLNVDKRTVIKQRELCKIQKLSK